MLSLKDLTEKEVFPGFFGKFIHGEKSTVAFWEIRSGSSVPVHSHPHEQTTYILEGELAMTIGGIDYLFIPGSFYVIPPNVEHNAFAKTNCKVIDFFSPTREEYKQL